MQVAYTANTITRILAVAIYLLKALTVMAIIIVNALGMGQLFQHNFEHNSWTKPSATGINKISSTEHTNTLRLRKYQCLTGVIVIYICS